MIEFTDILYGTLQLPDWLVPFLKIPEFVRLRGVRLSNVDSFQFKDFGGPSRWEHGIAVAWLALRCAEKREMLERDRVHLTLAALLHDVATPPFAHTAEYVLEGFDHELESQNLLCSRGDQDFAVDTPVFASQLPQFRTICEQLSKSIGVKVDPDEVARMVVGDGDFGFLVHGSVDLDNADNVTRACRYLGIEVDPTIPPRVADWLAVRQSPPTELDAISDPAVAEWREYRTALYGRFLNSGDEELGRQAFLQHLMRRAIRAGMSRRSLIWNTDERFLLQLENLRDPDEHVRDASIEELTQRYRLLEAAQKVAHVDIDRENLLNVISQPQAVSWIEDTISSRWFQPFVMVIKARHAKSVRHKDLFPPSPGALLVFKLGGRVREGNLPNCLRRSGANLPDDATVTVKNFSQRLLPRLVEWGATRPWGQPNTERKTSIVNNLGSFGNWGFRLSRNDSCHPYPGTFVHAIPAGLIVALGLQGDIIVDPFGGTGQTAVEGAKLGCTVVSGDSNSIACLATRARITFLDAASRQRLRAISRQAISSSAHAVIPDFNLKDKWFHKKTFGELLQIKHFIDKRREPTAQQFLMACFSAIITSCTGRKGKEHGYFADNTPLEKGIECPPYQDAIALFLARIERNLQTTEALYAQFERDGKTAETELSRCRAVRANVRDGRIGDYGVSEGSVGAIITSPPYLCMADYSLGQRLSYYLTMPDQLDIDCDAEFGKRRERFNRERALEEYRKGILQFATLSKGMLRSGGFLATVLGTPTALDFSKLDMISEFDSILADMGFELLWNVWRPINWHRNHGYARLKRERVAVHLKR
ncbi:MAG: HD domain-containing protein [Planctomycetes bacterium]|nr:HD domain-containing protein [Planctomycetota bacterium]